MSLQYKIVTVTAFEQNCSVLWCDETNEAAVVDPGGDIPKILDVIQSNNLVLKKIILTHAHIDHAGAVAELAEKFSLPIEGPQVADQFWIDLLPQQSQMFGFPAANKFVPNRWLNQDDTVEIGKLSLKVFHCPGHTPGHVVFYHEESKLVIVGDVLFQGSIGRTDFPQGDFDTLTNSIRTHLWSLPIDTQFIPGHGPMSTIGHEKATNPFVAGYG